MRTTSTVLTVSLGLALAGAACGDSTAVVDAGGTGTTPPPTTAPAVPDGVDVAALEDLGDARLRWEAAALDTYRYTYTRACECGLETRGPNRVLVRDGVVDEVVAADTGEPVDVVEPAIDELFDRIEASILAGEQVSVTYDEALGHPVSVALDIEAMAVDGGYGIEIRSVTEGADDGDHDAARGALADLEAAQARWAEQGPASYELTYQALCFCPEIVQTVTVRDGELVDVVTGPDGPTQIEGMTVDDLFAQLRTAITGGAHEVRASYDDELGHPVEYWIDEDPMIADEEHGVAVRSLEPLA